MQHQARASEFSCPAGNSRDIAYPDKIIETPQIKLGIRIQIAQTLARHYQFTEEKLDFIVNYDIKYRMDRDSDESE